MKARPVSKRKAVPPKEFSQIKKIFDSKPIQLKEFLANNMSKEKANKKTSFDLNVVTFKTLSNLFMLKGGYLKSRPNIEVKVD